MLRDLLRLASWLVLVAGSLGAAFFALWHLALLREGSFDDAGLVEGVRDAIFIIWIPVAFLGWQLWKEDRESEYWSVVLRGAPPWLRHLEVVVCAYSGALIIARVVWGTTTALVATALGLTFYLAAALVGLSGVREFRNRAG